MLNINFQRTDKDHYKILCLGAHSDDIEIGCGGSILRLLSDYKNTEVRWVIFSSSEERACEAAESAELFLQMAVRKSIVIKTFRDGFFPYVGTAIKEYFEEIKEEFIPDIIFTHYHADSHQDHRLISELTWNTFRNNLILEYEIIKYDGDLGNPGLFIHLSDDICRKKIDYILRSFRSQLGRGWFTEDSFKSILRIRGIESNAPQKYSEAFYCRKIVF
jgi:LmbE family N-acetylglucosaminyl deacetylase